MYYWKRNFISEMRRFSILIIFMFIGLIAHSQDQLINIVNAQTGKIIKVKLGDRMTVQYRGYGGQLSFIKDEVSGADDQLPIPRKKL
jgi:hypothetical protein